MFLLVASTLGSGSFLVFVASGSLPSAVEYKGDCNALSIFIANGTYYEAYSTSNSRWMMGGGAGGNATAINDNGYMVGSIDGGFHPGCVWPPTGGTIELA